MNRLSIALVVTAITIGTGYTLPTNAAIVNVGSDAVKGKIVVSHDVNTLASQFGDPMEQLFATNVAEWLIGSNSGDILAIESQPSDLTRNYDEDVKNALFNAGFNVTYESNPANISALSLTDVHNFDALFVGITYPSPSSINPTVLTQYVNGGGHVYMYSGVGTSAVVEASFLNPFLNNFGLSYDTSGYNAISGVNITSSHPIFDGITGNVLGSGNGQSIIDLGTNPNAEIVQFTGNQGVYAVVADEPEPVPEPLTILGSATALGVGALLKRESSKKKNKS